MNHAIIAATKSTPADTIYLRPSHLLNFRLRKLTQETAKRIAFRTQMFYSQRTPQHFSDALELFPAFLAVHLAIAWSIHIAYAIPDEDARVYSGRYVDLDTSVDNGYLTTLTDQVIRQKILSDYQIGYLSGMLTACHTTLPLDAQRHLWNELVAELSTLFISVRGYTEMGIAIFRDLTNGPARQSAPSESHDQPQAQYSGTASSTAQSLPKREPSKQS